jgi:ribonuclease P protein component
MITRTHRFHGLGSLRFAYTKGKTVRTSELGLRFVENSRRSTWRAAVVVSKKVHKSAVKRNRIRRQLYEILRQGPAISKNVDLVFTVYSEAALELTFADLERQVTKLLKDARVV